MELIDTQSLQHGQFEWIMVYECHLTKFIILRLLPSKRAAEVGFQLLNVFFLSGAQAIQQSDNGSEFAAQIITDVKELWPELIMVHGKPRYPQIHDSVERTNSDIKDIFWLQ